MYPDCKTPKQGENNTATAKKHKPRMHLVSRNSLVCHVCMFSVSTEPSNQGAMNPIEPSNQGTSDSIEPSSQEANGPIEPKNQRTNDPFEPQNLLPM